MNNIKKYHFVSVMVKFFNKEVVVQFGNRSHAVNDVAMPKDWT